MSIQTARSTLTKPLCELKLHEERLAQRLMEAGWNSQTSTLAINLLRQVPEDKREEKLECLLTLDKSIVVFHAREKKRETDTRRTETDEPRTSW